MRLTVAFRNFANSPIYNCLCPSLRVTNTQRRSSGMLPTLWDSLPVPSSSCPETSRSNHHPSTRAKTTAPRRKPKLSNVSRLWMDFPETYQSTSNKQPDFLAVHVDYGCTAAQCMALYQLAATFVDLCRSWVIWHKCHSNPTPATDNRNQRDNHAVCKHFQLTCTSRCLHTSLSLENNVYRMEQGNLVEADHPLPYSAVVSLSKTITELN
jgi:hypothetical protein